MKQLIIFFIFSLFCASIFAQNVGIGTLAPGYKLDVNGRMRIRHLGETAGVWFNGTDNTEAAFLGMLRDTIVGFYGLGNWRILADVKNARLGINNGAPTASLAFDNNTGNKIDFYNAAGTSNATNRYGIGLQGGLLQIYSATSSDDIVFGYGASNSFSELMRIRGNGRVGIGTTLPTAKLDIRENGSATGLNVTKTAGGTGIYAQNNDASSASLFAYNSGSGPSIVAIGNVGINTASPEFPLDVSGGRIRIQHGGSPSNTAGVWFDGITNQQRAFLGMIDNDNLGLYGATGWNFAYNTTNGNMGLGNVTPNSKLQVSGSVSLPYKRLDDANYTVTDNDYSIRIFISAASGINKVIVLPQATSRAGRIYVISASIPEGTSNASASKVTILDAGGTNVLNGSNIIAFNTITYNYLANYYNRTVYSGLSLNLISRVKQTSITVQSDGANWQVISNDFSTVDIPDYYD